MKKRRPMRLLALLLCLCLLAPGAIAQEEEAAETDDSIVTRSIFTLDLDLHADAFPADGKTDFKGWEEFLSKLSLSGTIDTQRFLTTLSRVYFEGDLNLNGEPSVPFSYEGYWNYRYIRSKALLGQSIHFQMDNFLEFMLKPYYYMGLPTQYLGLLCYPEATAYMLEAYGEPIRELVAGSGEGTRTISYVELYELCEQLDALASDDERERVYFYVTALLVDLQASDSTFNQLCYLEDYLDFLDPGQQGMTITVDDDNTTYTIGDTTILTHYADFFTQEFVLTLPNREGFVLTLSYHCGDRPGGPGSNINAQLTVTADDDTRVDLSLDVEGFPKDWESNAGGFVVFRAKGSDITQPIQSLRVDFNMVRTALEPPFETTLLLDWIHPETGMKAISMLYDADIELHDESYMLDRLYDNRNDFFHLNEGYLEELKEKFTLPLALAFTPVLMETPPGVINDILRFLDETNLLESLGIE